MTTYLIYSTAAALLVGLGLHGVIVRRHLVRQVLALNVLGGGVFLLMIAVAFRNSEPGFGPDPVPQALVLTGIVVAISVSALALAIARAIHGRTGRTRLTEEDLE